MRTESAVGSLSVTQDWKLHKEPTADRVCVVALETGCHSVMGCICSFTVTTASLLAANKQAQKPWLVLDNFTSQGHGQYEVGAEKTAFVAR